MLALVENVRKKQLQWLSAILLHNGWKRTTLAQRAGVDPSTLTRFANDKLGTAQLNSRTVEMLAEAGGIPPYHSSPPSAPRGFTDNEAVPYQSELDNSPTAMFVEMVKRERNAADPWQLKSDALVNIGYFPGDIVFVDLNETPINGDIVCAQVYDNTGQADTVFRIYEFPYLVAASNRKELLKPAILDNDRAQVRGVVIASMRGRASPQPELVKTA